MRTMRCIHAPSLEFCAYCLGLFAGVTSSSSARPPNIIFILSDDLGFGDVSISTGVNRARATIPTPHIQRLADNGMKLTRAYTGPICAPSRCTLMTGRHMGRCTIRGNDGTYSPLLPSDITVATVLRETHVTGLVGKWGLGDFNSSGYPLAQGFDYFVGQDSQVGCHDWYPTTIQNNTISDQPLNTLENLGAGCLEKPGSQRAKKCIWANDLVKAEAVGFVRAHASGARPFFLYLSTTTPHAGFLQGVRGEDFPVPYPYSAAAFLDPSWPARQRHFASAVWAQDRIVGAVLDELEAQGIEEETVVFFSGDNGPDSHDFSFFDDVGSFRGKKASLHEGGVRQTVAVQWKGTVPPGSSSSHLFAFWDLLPTAAELAGVPERAWPATDGVSIAPLLTGMLKEQRSHTYLYWEYCCKRADGLLPQLYAPGWVQAIRLDEDDAEWKGIRSDRGALMLFNLTGDVSESIDVAEEHPEVTSRMAKLMEEAHTESEHWPSTQSSKDKCCQDCFTAHGCAAPCKSQERSALVESAVGDVPSFSA